MHHRERLARAPSDIREYRYLTAAYVAAGRHHLAQETIDAGLTLAADDRHLIASRGEVRAATGDPQGALADWARAVELDDSDISPLYSTAYLLEREGRLDEAAGSWRAIVGWQEQRGYPASEHSKNEYARISQSISSS